MSHFLSEVITAINLKAEQMTSRTRISTAKQYKSLKMEKSISQFQEVTSQESSMETMN